MRVEIRPGEGGDDAATFARELVDAVTAACRRDGIAAQTGGTDRTWVVDLDRPSRRVAALAGTHRVQRVPTNDGSRRHTSTVTVAVLDGRAPDVVDVDPGDVREDTYRGTGAGGQHRNVTDSCVRLTHRPTGTVVTACGDRSQGANRQAAWAELRRRLAADAAGRVAEQVAADRAAQIGTGERPGREWTWTAWRDEVRQHATGRRYRMRDVLRGRWAA